MNSAAVGKCFLGLWCRGGLLFVGGAFKTLGMTGLSKHLKIGTRGSPLALAQTGMVRSALAAHFSDIQFEIVVIKTSGDWTPEHGEVRLAEAERGKAQFAREIEEALLRREIDLAVHSMKDMDSHLPEGLMIGHMLPREDVCDVLVISNKNKYIKDILANNSQYNKNYNYNC